MINLVIIVKADEFKYSASEKRKEDVITYNVWKKDVRCQVSKVVFDEIMDGLYDELHFDDDIDALEVTNETSGEKALLKFAKLCDTKHSAYGRLVLGTRMKKLAGSVEEAKAIFSLLESITAE